MHEAQLDIITPGCSLQALLGPEKVTCREMYSNAIVWMQTFDHCCLPLEASCNHSQPTVIH